MDKYLNEAYKEALKGEKQGGEPIGAVLVENGKIIGRGHNQRVQKNSVVLHAEMDCLERAGRLKIKDYRKCTMYTTLSPCDMCSGAILLYKIPRVVIGDNKNFKGPECYLRKRGVKVEVLNDKKCIETMKKFIKKREKLWNEDVGE